MSLRDRQVCWVIAIGRSFCAPFFMLALCVTPTTSLRHFLEHRLSSRVPYRKACDLPSPGSIHDQFSRKRSTRAGQRYQSCRPRRQSTEIECRKSPPRHCSCSVQTYRTISNCSSSDSNLEELLCPGIVRLVRGDSLLMQSGSLPRQNVKFNPMEIDID
jgi:hypothetical protein